MALLTRDQILNAEDLLVSEPLKVPEWGGEIRVRMLSGRERNIWRSQTEVDGKTDTTSDIEAKFLALTCCDEQGRKMFELADVERLAAKSAKALTRVFLFATSFNAITRDALDDSIKN